MDNNPTRMQPPEMPFPIPEPPAKVLTVHPGFSEAKGYLELGMRSEVWRTIDAIPEAERFSYNGLLNTIILAYDFGSDLVGLCASEKGVELFPRNSRVLDASCYLHIGIIHSLCCARRAEGGKISSRRNSRIHKKARIPSGNARLPG